MHITVLRVAILCRPDRFIGIESGDPQEARSAVSSASLAERGLSRGGISFDFGHGIRIFTRGFELGPRLLAVPILASAFGDISRGWSEGRWLRESCWSHGRTTSSAP